ncbi:MAG: Nif11-like leader peptide family RiPP precursor [Nitrospirae bacterium]|nr:Nif11-like leader peptide family RiPP precursor [Nitrospirota bacterium]
MSVESAKSFMLKLSSDAPFRNKVEAVKDESSRMKMVKDAGFDFTMAELKKVVPEEHHGHLSKTSLSEKDLEKVAGGSSASWASVGVGAAVGAAG